MGYKKGGQLFILQTWTLFKVKNYDWNNRCKWGLPQANLVLQNLTLFPTLCSVYACQMQNKRMVTMILSLFHMCINWFLGKNYQLFWHYFGTICLGTSSLLIVNTRLLSCRLSMDIRSFLALSIYNGISMFLKIWFISTIFGRLSPWHLITVSKMSENILTLPSRPCVKSA